MRKHQVSTEKGQLHLVYDGQGFWLCQKRLSQGRFSFWPEASPGQVLAPHALAVLLSGGDHAAAGGRRQWPSGSTRSA
ncbi:IS66 family insertion sequence element accessory protein TnpB [Accumulibacter sp.]|uniref:IS66 family insertion sequence element accessory protein TnpB n=1 Tax=Accumulibacter sp. TaxID=2053492 RepID=UPI0035B09D2B